MAIQPKSGSRTGGRRNQVPNKTGQDVNPYLGAQQLQRPKTGLGPMRNLATSNTMVSIGAMGQRKVDRNSDKRRVTTDTGFTHLKLSKAIT